METVLSSLRKAIVDVQRTTTQGSQEDILANQLIQSQSLLRSQWRNAASPNVESEYLRSLQFDIDQLTELSRSTSSREALIAVSRDLEIKTRFSKFGTNATAGFSDKVSVTVQTFRGGVEVKGYLIRCNPNRWAQSKTPSHIFSSSSPTSALLPPGYYQMWAEDAAGKIIVTRDETVGETGASEQIITFPLP